MLMFFYIYIYVPTKDIDVLSSISISLKLSIGLGEKCDKKDFLFFFSKKKKLFQSLKYNSKVHVTFMGNKKRDKCKILNFFHIVES
jgi:general stress protein 26